MPSLSKEEERLMRSVGMGIGSSLTEDQRVMRHVATSHGRAVEGGTVLTTPGSGTFDPASIGADITKALNDVRVNPKEYGTALGALEPAFDGLVFAHPERVGKAGRKTTKGSGAIADAIAALGKAEPSASLTLSDLLSKVPEQRLKNASVDLQTRLERGGGEAQFGKVAEVTVRGEKSGREIVDGWMLGDTAGDRTVRELVLGTAWREVGVATGVVDGCRVIHLTFAVAYKPKGQLSRVDAFVTNNMGNLSVALQCLKCETKRENKDDKFCQGCGAPFVVPNCKGCGADRTD
eukprot:CAMPEP_0170750562 /NCGR_PEP_ID=MMETSP0437-20130122/10994_1 /TAXON_ID=0 /ORGANISM="Sexangularia sp." /LENGTH=291 /DNA_ID=CAMNT_0011089559 /DNA_START=111 /DNA_END=983 /DNA_ORIENTATION=+